MYSLGLSQARPRQRRGSVVSGRGIGALVVNALMLWAGAGVGAAWRSSGAPGAQAAQAFSSAPRGLGFAAPMAVGRHGAHRQRPYSALRANTGEASAADGVQEERRRVLRALPIPSLPAPFNRSLAALLGSTPSYWRARSQRDWSVEPSPAAVGGEGSIPSAGTVTAAVESAVVTPSAQSPPPPPLPIPPSPGSKREGKKVVKGRSRLQHTISKNTQRVAVGSTDELEELLRAGVSVYQMDIRGCSLPDCQDAQGRLLDPTAARPTAALRAHPVVAALQARRRNKSKPGARSDGYKIALAIEGGGLRGCVSAGMASALAYLGMEDCFDMVLGSSAGSIIGAYFVARATPATTYQFFCNHLTTSKDHLDGASWLDISRLVDLFSPRAVPRAVRSEKTERRQARPAMLLDYPMDDIMQRLCPLDWDAFARNDAKQPMYVIAAGLLSEGTVSLTSAGGSFTGMCVCMCVCVCV